MHQDDGQHLTLHGLRVGPVPPEPPAAAAAAAVPLAADAVLIDEDGVAVALGAATVRVGRSPTADVRFEDPTVSRRHAVIVRDGDGFALLDDRSLNGVWVNGRRVTRARLRDGDVVEIGRHRLAFRAGPSMVPEGTADAA